MAMAEGLVRVDRLDMLLHAQRGRGAPRGTAFQAVVEHKSGDKPSTA
jgi:hypothetical protein